MQKLKQLFLGLLLPGCLFAAPVHEQLLLDVAGNTKVYLEVSGPRPDAPLLLYVHGGPANVVLGLLPFQAYVGPQLEKDFLVAYLHQRGAGKSPDLPDSSPISFADDFADIDRVVSYLFEKYHQRKVNLVGHSVGGMLTIMYAAQHQDRVAKIVLISTAMNLRKMLHDGYDVTLAWAKEQNMKEAVTELEQVNQKFETWQDFMALSKWANQARGGVLHKFNMAQFLKDQNVDRDYPNWGHRMSLVADRLATELMNVDLERTATSVHVPALFVAGGLDTIVPARTMRRDFESYRGEKEFLVLPDSHHLSFVDQPDDLGRAIDHFLLK